MDHSIYKTYREQLKTSSILIKQETNDKGLIREAINLNTDSIIRDLDYHLIKEEISEKQFNLYCNWLSSLACKLHP